MAVWGLAAAGVEQQEKESHSWTQPWTNICVPKYLKTTGDMNLLANRKFSLLCQIEDCQIQKEKTGMCKRLRLKLK